VSFTNTIFFFKLKRVIYLENMFN